MFSINHKFTRACCYRFSSLRSIQCFERVKNVFRRLWGATRLLDVYGGALCGLFVNVYSIKPMGILSILDYRFICCSIGVIGMITLTKIRFPDKSSAVFSRWLSCGFFTSPMDILTSLVTGLPITIFIYNRVEDLFSMLRFIFILYGEFALNIITVLFYCHS